MSNVEITRELRDWYLVHLCDNDGQTFSLIVWGVPTESLHSFVRTSPVSILVPEPDGQAALVHTSNSVYRVVGSGTQIHLSLTAAEMLSQGHCPDDVSKLYRPVERKPEPSRPPSFDDHPSPFVRNQGRQCTGET